MVVWLSVAWMKSPGSIIRSRATVWQMPGDTPPRAAKACTPVLAWKGSEAYAIGGRGGSRIPTHVLQVLLNALVDGDPLQSALDRPRLHHQWLPDELVNEPFGLSGDTQRALASRGHKFAEKRRYLGDAEGIMIEEKTGMRLGATDPRRSDGQAVGY